MDLSDDVNILNLFPAYIRPIIAKRVGNTEEGLPGFIAALMFAGSDIVDTDKNFLKNVIRKLYHKDDTIYYESQKELASILFGTSVDYVSNLL